jgi:fatty acid desaturase
MYNLVMSRDGKSNSHLSRLKVLLAFSAIGLIFIVAGTYWWTPLIIVGIVFIVLGYFLADF